MGARGGSQNKILAGEETGVEVEGEVEWVGLVVKNGFGGDIHHVNLW